MNNRKHTIIVFRHGYAEDFFGHPRDFQRKLTETGHQLAKEAGQGLKTIFPSIDRILHSPLIRAEQTAQHIHENYKGIPLLTAAWLAEPNLIHFFQSLSNYTGITVIVSHHPMVYNFSKMAIAGPWRGKGFTPNAMCVFEFPSQPIPKTANFLNYFSGEELAELADKKK
mgnify:CR=1 FL=1|jgi:phosphohistidine phosphatase SixA